MTDFDWSVAEQKYNGQDFDWNAAEQKIAENTPEQATGIGSSIAKGLSRGVDTTQALGLGLVGLAGTGIKHATGGDFGQGLEQWGYDAAQEQMRQAELSQPAQGAETFSEADSIADYANWAAFQFGSQIPTLASMAVTGGVGAAAGKAAVGRVVSKELGEKISSKLIRQKAKQAIEKKAAGELVSPVEQKAAQALAKAQGIGQTAGVIGGAAGLETGGMALDQVQEGVEPNVLQTAGMGLLAGGLEAATPLYWLRKSGVGRAVIEGVEKKTPGLAQKLLAVPATAGAEGATEVAQGIIERANLAMTKGEDFNDPAVIDEVINPRQAKEEFAAGALLGGVVGGAGKFLEGKFGTELQDRQKKEEEIQAGVDAELQKQAEKDAGQKEIVEEIAQQQTALKKGQKEVAEEIAAKAGDRFTAAQQQVAVKQGQKGVAEEIAARAGERFQKRLDEEEPRIDSEASATGQPHWYPMDTKPGYELARLYVEPDTQAVKVMPDGKEIVEKPAEADAAAGLLTSDEVKKEDKVSPGFVEVYKDAPTSFTVENPQGHKIFGDTYAFNFDNERAANKAKELITQYGNGFLTASETSSALDKLTKKAEQPPLIGEDITPQSTAKEPFNITSLTKIGEAKGSNPGGVYKDSASGQEFYLKTPSNPEHAKSEVLASKLARMAGIYTPRADLMSDGAVVSKIVPGLSKHKSVPISDEDMLDGFVANAWLANWDVAGQDGTNVQYKADKNAAVQLDFGGALTFRAKGGKKLFGPVVEEMSSLLDSTKNSQAANAFKNLTTENLIRGFQNIAAIKDEKLEQLVNQYGPEGVQAKEHLVATLIARKKDIAQKITKKLVEEKKEGILNWLKYDTPYNDLHTLYLNTDPHKNIWTDASPSNISYGIVLIDPTSGKVLLRKPTGNFDGYSWTFAKGGAKSNEHPLTAALREVKEETGYDAKIVNQIEDLFYSGSGKPSAFYVGVIDKNAPVTIGPETSAMKLVDFEDGQKLIKEGTNKAGIDRDLQILSKIFGKKPSVITTDVGVHQPVPGVIKDPKKFFDSGEFKNKFGESYPSIANKDFAKLTRLQRLTVAVADEYMQLYGKDFAQPNIIAKVQKEVRRRLKNFKKWTTMRDHPNGVSLAKVLPEGVSASAFETGKGVVVTAWHGSNSPEGIIGNEINVKEHGGTGISGSDTKLKEAFYASNKKSIAHGMKKGWQAKVYPLFIVFKNPLVVHKNGAGYHGSQFTDYIKQAMAEGRDGVIVTKVSDIGGVGHQYLALNTWNQVKTQELDNIGYDINEPGIYKAEEEGGVKRTVAEAEGIIAKSLNLGRAKRAGLVKVISDEEAAKRGWPKNRGGFWDGNKITVRAGVKDPLGTILHEGTHGGDELLLNRSYDVIQKQIQHGIENGDALLVQAEKTARDALKGKEEDKNYQKMLEKERLAYAVQAAELGNKGQARGWLKRVLDDVRIWWRTTELGQSFARLGIQPKLDHQMLLGLAKGAFNISIENKVLEEKWGGGAKGGTELEQKVWHVGPQSWAPEPGFPHGRPRLDKVGTGEGGQLFGWGWYSAENEETRDSYNESFSRNAQSVIYIGDQIVDWNSLPPSKKNVLQKVLQHGGDIYDWMISADAEGTRIRANINNYPRHQVEADLKELEEDQGIARSLIKEYDSATVRKETGKASVYHLNIPDSSIPFMLQWDKPLSEQTEEVKAALLKMNEDETGKSPSDFSQKFPDNITGEELYTKLSTVLTDIKGKHPKKKVSEYLRSLGIVGNKYLDYGSREPKWVVTKPDGEQITFNNKPNDEVVKQLGGTLSQERGTFNYVIWDQPTLDKVAHLNPEIGDAIENASNERQAETINVRGDGAQGVAEGEGNLAEDRGGILQEDVGRGESLADEASAQRTGDLESLESTSPPLTQQEIEDYAARNRALKAPDRTRKQHASDILYRAFAPGGVLSSLAPGAYKWVQRRDARLNLIDSEVERLVDALERDSAKAFNKKWGELGLEKARMQKALEGDSTTMKSLPESVQAHIDAMRRVIDPLSKEYINILQEQVNQNAAEIVAMQEDGTNKGLISQQEKQLEARTALLNTIKNNLGSYLNRSYQVFDNKKWYRDVPPDVMNRARKYLVSKGMTKDKADHWMENFLKDNTAFDSFADWIRERKVGETDKTVLIHKKEIAQPILDLMGVYKDPRINFAKTASKLSRLVFNTRLQKEIMRVGLDSGWLWHKGEIERNGKKRPNGYVQTIGGGKGYEYLSSLQTSKEIKQGLQDILHRVNNPEWLRTVMQFAQAAKWAKTIGSPAPTGIRNYASAWMGLLANGDWSTKGFKDALAGAKEYLANIDAGNQHEALKHKKLLGVSLDTPYVGEMRDLSSQAGIDAALEDSPNELKSGIDKLKQKGLKAKKFLERFYSFGDDFVKIIAFESQKKQMQDMFDTELKTRYEGEKGEDSWEGESYGRVELKEEDGKWVFRDPFGANINIGNRVFDTEAEARNAVSDVMAEWDIENRAAERIRNTYMTYSMVGALPKWFAKFPLTGTFVSFPVEVIRTVANMAKYTAQDLANEKTRAMGMRRLVSMGVTFAGVYALESIFQAAFGIDDEELKAAKQGVPEWNKLSNLLPIGRDEDGNVELFDFGYVDLYKTWRLLPNALRNGEPLDEAMWDATKEMLLPFFGLDITAQAVHETLMNEKSSGGPIWELTDSPLEQNEKILGHLMKPFMSATLVQGEKLRETLTDEMPRYGKKPNFLTELGALFGAKSITVEPKKMLALNNYEFQQRKRDYMTGLSRAISDPNDAGEEGLRQTFDNARKIRDDNYAQLVRKIGAARILGMQPIKLRRVLKSLGVAQKDIPSLMRGEIPPWYPEVSTLIGAEKKAESAYDTGTRRMIGERRRQVLKWIRESNR